VAQNIPIRPRSERVPIMDAAALEDRTRPLEKDPTPIWLRHRLQSRETSAATRAREWLRGLVSVNDR